MEDNAKTIINVAGDYVQSKHVDYEINNVEAGGIGIQVINGDKKSSANPKSNKTSRKSNNSTPYTIRYINANEQRTSRLQLLMRCLRALDWIEEPKSADDFMDFFEKGGKPIYDDNDDKSYIAVAPVEQYMISTGKRQFKGYDSYDDLTRLLFDLETTGLDPHADQIDQIGIRTNKGFEKIITVTGEGDEKKFNELKALDEFFRILAYIKPDIVSGHNSENFDWNFIDVRLTELGEGGLKDFTSKYFRKAIYKKKKQQVKELDNLAQAIFYDMFGEDRAIEQNWLKCCVGDIYQFQYGKGNNIPEDEGEYPCYGSNGIVGHHITYNSEDAPVIGHIGAYAGIVNWGAGKHYVTYNGVICKLKDNRNNPIYGYYMLKSQDYLNVAKRGGAQPFVSYDLLEQPTTFMPPLSLQQSFAAKVETIEHQKELINQSIREAQTLFDSRMEYYFGE